MLPGYINVKICSILFHFKKPIKWTRSCYYLNGFYLCILTQTSPSNDQVCYGTFFFFFLLTKVFLNFRTSFWWNCIFIVLILWSSTGLRYCVAQLAFNASKRITDMRRKKSFSVMMVFALMSQDAVGNLPSRSSTSTHPEELELQRSEKDVRGKATPERWLCWWLWA